MPSIVDDPPKRTQKELEALNAQLDRDVPKKGHDKLLIATWNIREFGRVTPKWRASQTDTPKRDLHCVRCIAEIVRRFDVVAIQEVQFRVKALRTMLEALDGRYAVILTDAVLDDAGDEERLAFAFDRSRVEVSGLACELVVPVNWTTAENADGIEQAALGRQFARTPYAVEFKRKDSLFVLVTLHVDWGDESDQGEAEREEELSAIARWMRAWATDRNSWNQNLICLGDFNIDRHESPLWQAFTSTGLTVPEPIARPRTIGGKPLKGFYDQIAWFTEDAAAENPLLSLEFTDKAAMFDWSETVLAKSGLTKRQKSFRMSDHYPLWAEFSLA